MPLSISSIVHIVAPTLYQQHNVAYHISQITQPADFAGCHFRLSDPVTRLSVGVDWTHQQEAEQLSENAKITFAKNILENAICNLKNLVDNTPIRAEFPADYFNFNAQPPRQMNVPINYPEGWRPVRVDHMDANGEAQVEETIFDA